MWTILMWTIVIQTYKCLDYSLVEHQRESRGAREGKGRTQRHASSHLRTHTWARMHTLRHAPSIQPLWCSMQHLSGKKTDKSKWTYCRIRWWRSFDSGPPNSHWDTWWRENKTQRGRIKDTEGRRGIRQEERNIKTGREAGTREGVGGQGKGGREQRDEGLENSTIHQLQRKRDDLHTVTSPPPIWHHYYSWDIITVMGGGSCDGGAGGRWSQRCRPLTPLSHAQTQMGTRCTRTAACFAPTG